VEWPERIAEAIPPDALHLELRIQPDQNHHLLLRRAAAAKQATQA
jgi:tRNA A37 threonylcarbamoyladenosine biosynthesis protein TsaE